MSVDTVLKVLARLEIWFGIDLS